MVQAEPVKPGNGRYLKVAHRGASAYAPENTLKAYRLALEMGADMNEVDVHLTADGVPVLMHDGFVREEAGTRRPIGELSLERLRARDAGAGERVPTLQEALDVAGEAGGLYIELKGEGTAAVVVDLVRRNGFADRAIVGSFDPQKVRAVKALAPEVETALLLGRDRRVWAPLCREAGVDYAHFCWEGAPQPHRLLDAALFETARQYGLKVVVWHEERPEEIREIVRLPIAAICSNQPDLL